MIIELTGTVQSVVRTDKQTFVCIVDQDNDLVAAKFWGRNRSEVDGVMAGQRVRVTGHLKSREWNGKMFTDLDTDRLVVTSDGVTEAKGKEPAPVDDGEIPF